MCQEKKSRLPSVNSTKSAPCVFSMSVVPGACDFEVQRWCEAAKSRIKYEHPILHRAIDEEDKHPVLPS